MTSKPYQLLFLTERSPHHQQAALEAAPAHATILARLPPMDFLISERAGVIDAEMIAAGQR